MAVATVTGHNRRGKTALFLCACGCVGAAPHLLEAGRSLFPAITLAFVLGGYGLRTVLRGREKFPNSSDISESDIESLDQKDWPNIDIVVAARDEETVVKRLVEGLYSISYPDNKLSIWIVDDASKDKTPIILDQLKQHFPTLNVLNRKPEEGGGKSGALNAALKKLKGEWLFVLDADAQLQDDLLKRMVFIAERNKWSAVQLRKAVVNADQNPLTRIQAMEMAMDALIQKGRLVGGGVGELRGNGQLLRRSVLEECGGFNEETLTDDLDLSFRFLISGSVIGLLWNPPVNEEAVETIPALWRQRQRWAEGGLQRFFDYFPTLISNHLTIAQRRDLFCFFLLQYALPLVSFADLITTIFTRSYPVYWPLSLIAFSISGLAFWRGCRIYSEGPAIPKPKPFLLIIAILYLVHWFFVIPWVTVKMVIFPKRLFWAKTKHKGQNTLQV